MGRLIDADELLKRFRYGEADTDNDKAWISTIRRMIKEQPTAYDVDKVVEELEEERMRYFITIANTGDASLDIAYKEVSGAIEKAIDIVKRGGVE